MALNYKVDILEELKKNGYSAYRLRKEKIMGERTIQRLRNKDTISFEVINKICDLLNCQPGDILEHTKE